MQFLCSDLWCWSLYTGRYDRKYHKPAFTRSGYQYAGCIVDSAGNVYDIWPTYLPYIYWICQEENSRREEKIRNRSVKEAYCKEIEYKGVIYEEGDYESLVITLGDGLGDNFWCVLFPPLCLLEAEETDTDEFEYTSFIKEIIDKYF